MPETPEAQETLLAIPLETPEPTPVDELIDELLPVPPDDVQRDLWAAVTTDHTNAVDDRRDWESNIDLWEKQYLGDLPEKTWPWEGCANFNTPLTMLAIETMKPRLVEAILGSDPIVYAVPTEGTDEERAERTELFLNWQIRSELKVEGMVDESAHMFLNPGIVVAKILWDESIRRQKMIRRFPASTPLELIFRQIFGDKVPDTLESDGTMRWKGTVKGAAGPLEVKLRAKVEDDEFIILVDQEVATYDAPRIHLLRPEDFVAPFNGGGDIQRLPWCTQRLYLTPDELRRKVSMGRFYADAVKALLGETKSSKSDQEQDYSGQEIQETRLESEGAEPQPATDVLQDQYEVLESYRQWDMDDDGYDEEIIVWAAPDLPDKILGWDYLDNVYHHGRRPYVIGRYLTLPHRLYGLSLPEVVRGIQEEINTMHNQRVDAGTIQNSPMVFFRASMTNRPIDYRVKPGEWVPVDDPQRDIRFPDWNGNTVFGQNEEALLYQYFERLTGLTDLALGRQPNRVGATRTATGVSSLLSEAGLRFKTAMEAFQRFWVEVFEHVLALDQQYLPVGKEFRVTGRVPELIKIADRTEIAGRYHLRLSATNETLNRAVMREDATIKLNAVVSNPIPLQLGLIGLKGMRKLYRDFMRAYGETDPDLVLEPTTQALVRSPEEELVMMASGLDPEPSAAEDIATHINTHSLQLRMPELSANPEVRDRLARHLTKTVQMAQAVASAMMMRQSGQKGGGGTGAGVGQQAVNAQIGKMAPEQPSSFGGGAGQAQ